ncbi:uncharacterized protein LOC131298249 [Rhododendron vialii]|uniref:uncharacterized protein LOC131298249 n=1 Tax=Rhododendron vialii TaxID=182163 RepID=UPI00265FC9AC|nr:uncharacterized protein LOC131298249 [Rhododendron vialii]
MDVKAWVFSGQTKAQTYSIDTEVCSVFKWVCEINTISLLSVRTSMKRGRKPKGLNNLKVHKEADQLGKQQNHYLGPSFVDLPEPISFDNLLRLSTKSLLKCRCVCKPWR